MRTLVHVTHEAVQKIGGIGAVLQGVFTSRNYNEAFERTILLGPLFTTEGAAEDRLGSAGEVIYSSLDGLDKQHVSLRTGSAQSGHQHVLHGWFDAKGRVVRPVDLEMVPQCSAEL